MKKMVKAAVMVKPGEIRIREFPYPSLEERGLLMRMEMSGICGTDKHSFRGGYKLYAGTKLEREFGYPIIPGHENVGIVEEIRDERKDYYGETLKVGDRIVMWPDVVCGTCFYCRDEIGYGFPWCENISTYGVDISCDKPPYLFGGWAEYMYILPKVFLYKVPEDVPPEMAVFSELMSFFYGLDNVGDTVVVQGVGPLGLCQVIKARAIGAGDIIAIDKSNYRLEMAATFGADYCLNVNDMSREERIQRVKELTHGRGAELVVECVGVPEVVPEGIEMLRKGGRYIEMGNYVDTGVTEINVHKHLCTKSIRLEGVSNHPYKGVGSALKYFHKYLDNVPVAKLISHRFKLPEAELAMKTSMTENSMKVVICP